MKVQFWTEAGLMATVAEIGRRNGITGNWRGWRPLTTRMPPAVWKA